MLEGKSRRHISDVMARSMVRIEGLDTRTVLNDILLLDSPIHEGNTEIHRYFVFTYIISITPLMNIELLP